MVVQHSMVGRSSQWTSVMPPASPVAFIARVKAGTLASNVGMVMNIFMLGWPPATACPTSARMSALGCDDHGVEEHVGDRLLGDQRGLAAHAVRDALPRQHEGHVADAGHAARQRRARAGHVVVDPVGLAGVEALDVQVHVRVDAAGQHQASAGVDVARPARGGAAAWHAVVDADDLAAGDADVGLPLSLRCDYRAAANHELELVVAHPAAQFIGGTRYDP